MPGINPDQFAAYGRMAASVKERFGDNWQLITDDEWDEISVRTEDSTVGLFTELFTTTQTGGDDPREVAGFLAASIDYVPALLAEIQRLRDGINTHAARLVRLGIEDSATYDAVRDIVRDITRMRDGEPTC